MFYKTVEQDIWHAGKVALEINTDNIILQGSPIECVNNFCYFCSLTITNGDTETDVNNSISKIRAAFKRLQSTWKSSEISRWTNFTLFNTFVKSTLLYESENWLMLNTITQRLLVLFWLNSSNNSDLWWIGYTIRKPRDSITRTALVCNRQGLGSLDRPMTT